MSQKSFLSICSLIIDLAPTTKAVGYKDVTKLEPTASVVGLQKKRLYILLRQPLQIKWELYVKSTSSQVPWTP